MLWQNRKKCSSKENAHFEMIHTISEVMNAWYFVVEAFHREEKRETTSDQNRSSKELSLLPLRKMYHRVCSSALCNVSRAIDHPSSWLGRSVSKCMLGTDARSHTLPLCFGMQILGQINRRFMDYATSNHPCCCHGSREESGNFSFPSGVRQGTEEGRTASKRD